jgi:UDP-N-acetylmuramoyl-L-alanyl-D-glutamate--2,6-diaminopimelate ligase
VNVDDPAGHALADACIGPMVGVGTAEHAAVRLVGWEVRTTGTSIDLLVRGEPMHLEARLRGLYTVRNVALAAGIGLAVGIDPGTVRAGIESLTCVPGRLEPVGPVEGAPLVLVDYAHTPDGLRNVLQSVREMTDNRVIVVFGCGGDRDRTKRPEMGAAAAELADVCIVTSDNPRSEDPNAIIDEIIPGLAGAPHERIVDRREAILRAVTCGRPGDIVVLAGKGHETYQEFASGRIDFDDRRVAAEALGLE